MNEDFNTQIKNLKNSIKSKKNQIKEFENNNFSKKQIIKDLAKKLLFFDKTLIEKENNSVFLIKQLKEKEIKIKNEQENIKNKIKKKIKLQFKNYNFN